MSYHKDFKLKDVLGVTDTFQHVRGILEREAMERELAGDYSRPVRLQLVLGRMHEYKQQAWTDHVTSCEAEAAEAAEREGLSLDEIVDKLEDGQTVFEYLMDYCPF